MYRYNYDLWLYSLLGETLCNSQHVILKLLAKFYCFFGLNFLLILITFDGILVCTMYYVNLIQMLHIGANWLNFFLI